MIDQEHGGRIFRKGWIEGVTIIFREHPNLAISSPGKGWPNGNNRQQSLYFTKRER